MTKINFGSMNKNRILIVTRNFPPLVGGMERLNLHICQALAKFYDVSVAGPKDSSKFHEVKSFVEFSAAPLWLYIFSSLIKTTWLALKNKPDFVFCGSGAAILAGFFAAKITGAKLVCYLHGLDIVANSVIYQNFFVPLIKKSDLIFVNSNHSKELAINAGIDRNKINILSPGTTLPSMQNRISLEEGFRQEYNLDTNPFLLIVGRLTPRKGVHEFIINVMPNLIVEYPQLKLLIVGGDSLESIRKHTGIRDRLHQLIESMNMQQNVNLLGGLSDETLSAAFFSASALIFPVLEIKNDVEGFGMVAIEAAAHGLPSVGFSVGGVPDAIGHGKSGWLVPSGEYGNMEEKIKTLLNSKFSAELTEDSITHYAKQFEWSLFEERLKGFLEKGF